MSIKPPTDQKEEGMKKFVALLAALMIAGFAAVSFADTEGFSTAKVYVNVQPNVSVMTLESNVNAGTVQTGPFSADFLFRVDANEEAVALAVAASPLFKGNDPTSTLVAPIPLFDGVVIQPPNANPIANGTNVAQYETDYQIDQYPGRRTNAIVFESSQPGTFSQDVAVRVSWNQDDPQKPKGEYSGKVRFFAMLSPAGTSSAP
jgi:hypothetical protein